MANRIIVTPVDSCPQLSYEISGLGHTHIGNYDSIIIDAIKMVSDVEASMDDDGQLDEDTWAEIITTENDFWEDLCRDTGNDILADLIIRVLDDMAEAGYDPVIKVTRLSDFTIKITLCEDDPTSDGYYDWLDIMRLSLVDFLSEYFDDEDDEIVIRGVCFMLDDVDDGEISIADLDELSDDEEDDSNSTDEPAAA